MVPGLRPFTNKALLVADSERSKLERNSLLRAGKFCNEILFPGVPGCSLGRRRAFRSSEAQHGVRPGTKVIKLFFQRH